MKYLALFLILLVAPSVAGQGQDPCPSVILPRAVATDMLKMVIEGKQPTKKLLNKKQSLLWALEHRLFDPCKGEDIQDAKPGDVAINFGNLRVLDNWRNQLRSGRISDQVLCQMCARVKHALGYVDKATVTKDGNVKVVDIQCPGRVTMLRKKVNSERFLA